MNKRSEAQAKFDAANTTRVYMKLNKKKDAAIIEKLEKQGSKQGYIKTLIRADINTPKIAKVFTDYIMRGYTITDVADIRGTMVYTMTAVRQGTARDPFGNATGTAEYIKEVEVIAYDDGTVEVERIK